VRVYLNKVSVQINAAKSKLFVSTYAVLNSSSMNNSMRTRLWTTVVCRLTGCTFGNDVHHAGKRLLQHEWNQFPKSSMQLQGLVFEMSEILIYWALRAYQPHVRMQKNKDQILNRVTLLFNLIKTALSTTLNTVKMKYQLNKMKYQLNTNSIRIVLVWKYVFLLYMHCWIAMSLSWVLPGY
jgi:hypothetical protein